MGNWKILAFAFLIAVALTLTTIPFNTSPAYAIYVGGGKNLEIELSPPERLFHPDEDGYFYPGSLKITRNLKVVNVGDVPFRICGFNATFYEDEQLANGLMIEIEELGGGKGEEPHHLYTGTLSSLRNGVEVSGKRAVPRGKSVTLRITVWMPETAGNEYQGLRMTADIAITAYFPPKE